MQRTTAGSVLFSTYNLLDAFHDDSAAGRERYRLVVEAIRALDADVLAVQEIRAPDEHTARSRLRQLADDAGMRCGVGAGDDPAAGTAAAGADPAGPAPGELPALGFGLRGYHVGLLWRDGIEPVPGSFHSRNRDLWHALAWVTLDVGGPQVRHAAYHASPFGRKIRVDQSEVLVAALARPGNRIPALIGADWNGESADRVMDEDGTWRLYEPGDPFQDAKWFEDMVHQCHWDYDTRGRRRHWADRSAGEALWAGGLHDAAAVLGAPWQPTSGHFPGDPFAIRGIRRRIDGVRVTPEVIAALRGHWVTDSPLTRAASDHLPVTVEYLPGRIEPVPAAGVSGTRARPGR